MNSEYSPITHHTHDIVEPAKILLQHNVWHVQGALQSVKLMRANKRKFTILHGLNGRITPGRMTLLLGPPGAGKSTLLMALAGKLRQSDLNVSTLMQNVVEYVYRCTLCVCGYSILCMHYTSISFLSAH